MPTAMPLWFSPPRSVTIRVGVNQMRRSPLGHEVVISCKIGDSLRNAVVPIHYVNEQVGTVQASQVGQIGDSILISFPATSEGTSTWLVSMAALAQIMA